MPLRIEGVEARGASTTYTVCNGDGDRVGFLHEYDDGRWGVQVLLTMETLEARHAALEQMRRALEVHRTGTGDSGLLPPDFRAG